MFTFSTTHVINTDKGNLTGGKNYLLKDDTLLVERRGIFKKELVKAIYSAAGKEGTNAKLTINMGLKGLTEGDNLRMDLYLGLSGGSADSRYSNDLAYKGKPLSVDFVWKGTASSTLEALKKTIDKLEMLVYGSKILKATVSGDLLILEATNEYQRFKKMEIVKYTASTTDYPYAGTTEVLKSLDNITVAETVDEVATAEGLFVGEEGFGTYSYVLHNLRIPTAYNVGPFVEGADEAPIVGGLYDQYTIRYCVERGPLGLNAVGDNVTSITTHVFYVLHSLAKDFEVALGKLATIEPVKDKETPAPTENSEE